MPRNPILTRGDLTDFANRITVLFGSEPVSAILPHTTFPSPLQERIESLANCFGVDEEHAMLRCLEITEVLLRVKRDHGGQVYVVLNGSQYPFEIGSPSIPI